MGLVTRRTKKLEGWNFRLHPLTSGKGVEAWRLGFWIGNTSRYWEGGTACRGHGSSTAAPNPTPKYLALGITSIWLFLSCILCKILVDINEVFSCVLLWAILINYGTWGGNCGNPQFPASWSEVQVAWDFWMASELGGVLWDWAL